MSRIAEKLSGGVPIAKFIRNSPVPACIGASTCAASDEAVVAALSLCNLSCPRFIPRWIRSNLVRFLPESTCLSVTRKPVCTFLCLRALLEVENVGLTNKMTSIASVTNMNKDKEAMGHKGFLRESDGKEVVEIYEVFVIR